MTTSVVKKGKYTVVAVSHKNHSLKLKGYNGDRWFTVEEDLPLPSKGDTVVVEYREAEGNRNPEILRMQVLSPEDPRENIEPTENAGSTKNGNGKYKYQVLSIAAVLSTLPNKEAQVSVIERALRLVEQF